MPNYAARKRVWKITAIAVLFMLLLTAGRLLWIESFRSSAQPHAAAGQLDLREWNAPDDYMISLDGEWEFYPHVWWMDGVPADAEPQMLTVPGYWNAAMPDGDSPHGYGSYRLRILVDPQRQDTYSIRMASVRSSSELYVNGRLLAVNGRIGTDRQTSEAGNIPRTVSFTADDSGMIEVIVQAANFNDPRGSGIVRSVKFGTEQEVLRETEVSVMLQMMTGIVFVMQAVYTLILYFVGSRDRKLLYFSLLAASLMVVTLLGSDEKVLHLWLPISYEWGFKLIHLGDILIGYAIMQSLGGQLPQWYRKLAMWFGIVCLTGVVFALLLPARYAIPVQPLFHLIPAFAVVMAVFTMLRTSIRQFRENTLLLLSLIALLSHGAWWGILMVSGVKVLYYPFDVITAMALFASVWFRQYFQIHHTTRMLAAQLQEADRRKDEFLANTSHELRNPLHGILNISQSVLERERSTMRAQSIADLEIVLSVGRRMSLMLNDLLDVMSLKEGSPRLQLRDFSLQAVVSGVMDMLRYMTEGKPVQFVNEVSESLPLVRADEHRVIQVMFNLLHNAVKYTNKGVITVRAESAGGRAYITVADTGIGMDAAALQRIFEPYEQIHNGKAVSEGGFGLGLSICRQLVQLHGGELEVASAPGKGSQFSFALKLAGTSPAAASAEDDDAREASPVPPTDMNTLEAAAEAGAAAAPTVQPPAGPQAAADAASAGGAGDMPRIVVVDDDPVNLKVITAILSAERYAIETATSGQEALELLAAKEWDLVISDVMMPHMSGYELTRTIRKRFTLTELPILLLTARNRPDDMESGFTAGANDYVIKPVDATELRSRVRALTAVRQSARERLRMEAAWLQAQIRPHFLFNTLNTVIALSEIDTNRMRDVLEAFGNLLRDKFKMRDLDELAPIEEELSIVRSYLFVEKERFEERLNVTWEIDECAQWRIPMLTIQPLVENALRHGIMKRLEGGNIWIRMVNHGSHAEITVQDDGVGMSEEKVRRILQCNEGASKGVGLHNTNLRLKRHYGKGLQIVSEPGRGTTVSFVVYRQKDSGQSG